MECQTLLKWQDGVIQKFFPLKRSNASTDPKAPIWMGSAIAPQDFTVYGLPVQKIQVAIMDTYQDGNHRRIERYRVLTTASKSMTNAQLKKAREGMGSLRSSKDASGATHIFTTATSVNKQDSNLVSVDCTVSTIDSEPLKSPVSL